MTPLHCQSCGARVPFDEPIPRDAECESCGADLRCCRNCQHYDVHFNNQCRETEAEPVTDKLRRNFCEFFSFSRQSPTGPGASSDRAADARAKLNALFGGPASPAPAQSDARARLEALFKKKSDPDSVADPD